MEINIKMSIAEVGTVIDSLFENAETAKAFKKRINRKAEEKNKIPSDLFDSFFMRKEREDD